MNSIAHRILVRTLKYSRIDVTSTFSNEKKLLKAKVA